MLLSTEDNSFQLHITLTLLKAACPYDVIYTEDTLDKILKLECMSTDCSLLKPVLISLSSTSTSALVAVEIG